MKNITRVCNMSLLTFAAMVTSLHAADSIAVTTRSNVPAPVILKILQKKCPNISVVNIGTTSDYTFEVLKTSVRWQTDVVSLTIVGHNGKAININAETLDKVVTGMCQVYGWDNKNAITVEVVDTSNLTQSVDARSSSGGLGLPGAGNANRRIADEAVSTMPYLEIVPS